jgi:DNA polymerase elongation subunit (family B)
LKLDRHFKKIIFKKKRGSEEGVKKRYAALVQWEDGKECDYILVKGFEYVRRDSSVVCKEIQYKMFELMLRKTKEDVLKYLREKLIEIRTGHYSYDDLATPKTLHKNPEDYPIPQDYVRGAIYSNKWLNMGIRDGDVVKMIYLKSLKGLPYTDVISVFSFKELKQDIVVDIEKVIEKTIKDKIEDLISLIGVSWKDLDSTQTRMSF